MNDQVPMTNDQCRTGLNRPLDIGYWSFTGHCPLVTGESGWQSMCCPMNSAPLLFLGIFATLASSFWGLVLVPQLQLGRQQQVTNSATLGLYPQPRSGSA